MKYIKECIRAYRLKIREIKKSNYTFDDAIKSLKEDNMHRGIYYYIQHHICGEIGEGTEWLKLKENYSNNYSAHWCQIPLQTENMEELIRCLGYRLKTMVGLKN